MGLGQAHLDGVFQISETEALLTFHSTTEMMATMCLLGATTVWHNEPIRLHTHPPTNSHLRAYVAARGACPSGTQTLTSGREVVSLSPPSDPDPEERPPSPFQMALRDLRDAQLRQLMEDLWQEVAQRDLTTSPIYSLSGLEVFCRRHGCCFWGWGSAPSGGMGTQQAATMAHSPPHIEEGVGHLLSTLAARLRLGTLRINTFSGDASPGKTEVSFGQWYHKEQCVKDHYTESVVWESIIRFLKGTAVDMAWYMGPTASVAHILRKLLVIFSTVAFFDVLMQNFYKVTQGNNEKVLFFAMRHEGTINQIRLQCPRRMTAL